MTPQIIERLGRLLFGPEWPSALGRALGVSKQTIMAWKNGAYAPRAERVTDAKALVRARIAELRAFLKTL